MEAVVMEMPAVGATETSGPGAKLIAFNSK